MVTSLFYILVFPGFLYLAVAGFTAEYIDRKLYARLQNRIGPPWFQPVADFIKLLSKEEIIPEEANEGVFRLMPVIALSATISAIFYIPMWGKKALSFFYGDIIIVLFLLTIPTMTYFLGGWYSTSLYSKIGAVRTITQLFAYEVPLFISILAAALLADTWCLSDVATFYNRHLWLWPFNLPGFVISLIALLGKLEKIPFDIPEAETEIVGGTFTEYGGRLLGLFRLAFDIEAVVGASLLAAIYIPLGLDLPPNMGFVMYLLEVLVIICALAVLRTLFARLRIDQMITLCWKYIAPIAFAQLLINLILKGVLAR